MDHISKEAILLCKQKIDTIEQLDYKENMTKYQLDSYIKERRCLYNKKKRCRNLETKKMLLKDIESLSKDIKQLREEVKLYESIRIRSVTMKDKLHSIYVEEHQQQKQTLKKDERLKQV